MFNSEPVWPIASGSSGARITILAENKINFQPKVFVRGDKEGDYIMIKS